MNKKLQLLWALLLMLLAFFSCTTEDQSEYRGMTGQIENLPPLSEEFEYQAWIEENTNVRRVGIVKPNEDGTAFLAFAPLPDQIRDARNVFITVELAGSKEQDPSTNRIMEGKFNGGEELELAITPIANFEGISGQFILDSPTISGSSTDNSGIWFVTESIDQGLTLPALPSDWTYEGWVDFNGTWISTGSFRNPDQPDLSDIYSGSLNPHPFPGEDFNQNPPEGISFPMDLANKEIMISLEPLFDNDPLPFGIKLLGMKVPSPSIAQTSISLVESEDKLPSGIVRKAK